MAFNIRWTSIVCHFAYGTITYRFATINLKLSIALFGAACCKVLILSRIEGHFSPQQHRDRQCRPSLRDPIAIVASLPQIAKRSASHECHYVSISSNACAQRFRSGLDIQTQSLEGSGACQGSQSGRHYARSIFTCAFYIF